MAMTMSAEARAMDAKRHFVVVCHDVDQVVTQGKFRPNNLLEGRVDVMCRCITSALYISNGVRKTCTIWLVLQPTGITVSVCGGDIFGLNPDEKTVALFLQRALEIAHVNSFGVASVMVAGGRDRSRISSSSDNNNNNNNNNESEPSSRDAVAAPLPVDKKQRMTKSDRNLALKHEERLKSYTANWERGDDGKPITPAGFAVYRGDALEDRLRSLVCVPESSGEVVGGGDTEGDAKNDHRNYSGSREGARRRRVLWLHEQGEHVTRVLGHDTPSSHDTSTVPVDDSVVVIVGDKLGFTDQDEGVISALPGVKKVALGRTSLLASQCIVLAHHYLDGDHALR